jgi:NAD(P)-dependent dehydrogenase (short-subunit alcohol dehydrogenase family)
MGSQAGRNFLVTGAGRGIGRGLSRLLLRNGHRVFLLDQNEEELNHTVSQLSKNHAVGKDFDSSLCNIRKASEIKAIAEKASQFFSSRLDCLVNNAAYTGGVGGTALSEMSLDDWNASIETNLTGPMLMSQACLPMLKKTESRSTGGCIIHMSSTRSFMSEPNNEPYSATKAGLLGLTQSMAVSLALDGIRCNAILPGWINVSNECKKADESGQKWEEGLSREDQQWHLSGRVGKVEDIWRTVEYLVESEFMTGAEIVVDGGVTRKMVYPEE